MKVEWVKNNQNNEWFDFLRLNLDAPYFIGKRGVYVIWYIGSPSKVVRVGSGNIAERLKEHRSNIEITKFSSFGPLKVSWVVANGFPLIDRDDQLLGVERFLAEKYSPLIGDRYPNDVLSIGINLIGAA